MAHDYAKAKNVSAMFKPQDARIKKKCSFES